MTSDARRCRPCKHCGKLFLPDLTPSEEARRGKQLYCPPKKAPGKNGCAGKAQRKGGIKIPIIMKNSS